MTKLKVAVMKLPSSKKSDFVKKALKGQKGTSSNYKKLMIILIPAAVVALSVILFKDQFVNWLERYQIGPSQESTPTPIAQIKPLDTPSPTPTPTPIPLLPGPGIYSVSHPKSGGPTISQVIFDPLDVHKGEKLVITVKITANSPVTTVVGTLDTDDGLEKLPFSRVSGTDTEGEWQVSFDLKDSVLYKYILTVRATAGGKSSQVIVAPRS